MTRAYRLVSASLSRTYWLDTVLPVRPGLRILVQDDPTVWTVATSTTAPSDPKPEMLKVLAGVVD